MAHDNKKCIRINWQQISCGVIFGSHSCKNAEILLRREDVKKSFENVQLNEILYIYIIRLNT